MEIREWVVEEYPPRTGHGMQAGKIGAGIRVTHCASGLSEVCTKYRSQHQNKEHCIRRIKLKLEASQ